MKSPKNLAMAMMLLGVMNSNVLGYDLDMKRCTTWGDTLDAKQAENRWKWALECDPTIKFLSENMPSAMPPQWANDAQNRRRRTYPVYGVVTSQGSGENEITTYSNPKKYFAPKDGSVNCNIPEGYKIAFLCLSGCLTPDQKIELPAGMEAIGASQKLNRDTVVTYFEDEDGQMETKLSPISYFTSSAVDGNHKILKFTAGNGKTIETTTEHPLIDGEGRVRQAATLKVGDMLKTTEGNEIIVEIETKDFYGKVHNLEINGKDLSKKVYNAQGFLNADVTFQNENEQFLNQLIFRMSTIQDSDVQ